MVLSVGPSSKMLKNEKLRSCDYIDADYGLIEPKLLFRLSKLDNIGVSIYMAWAVLLCQSVVFKNI